MTATEQAVAQTYIAPQVIALTGATYRMLDHWIRKGYLPKGAEGSGSVRMYGPAELDLVYLVVRLVDAGFNLEAAFPIARQLIAEDRYSTTVASIFELSIHVRDTSSEGAKCQVPTQEAPE